MKSLPKEKKIMRVELEFIFFFISATVEKSHTKFDWMDFCVTRRQNVTESKSKPNRNVFLTYSKWLYGSE